MVILSQDRDEIFTMGNVYFDEEYTKDENDNKGIFLGYCVYGYSNSAVKGFNDVLLGHYEEEADCYNIIQEIYNYLKSGYKHFSMPEPTLDSDELDDLMERGD